LLGEVALSKGEGDWMMTALKILFWILMCSTPGFYLNAFASSEIKYESVRTPAPVEDLVYVRPFALSRGYRWSSINDEPKSDRGFIVVLRVDPKLVIPRNAPSYILYAGDRMLQALNFGHTSGHVIGLIPGEVDLSKTLFWFGPPTTPGRVTPKSIRAERVQAEEAGILPFPAKKIESVMKPAIVTTSLSALLRSELADLVLEYAPKEGDLARKWRLPEAKAKPDKTRSRAVKPQRQRQEKE
jgi:hypothetical protein